MASKEFHQRLDDNQDPPKKSRVINPALVGLDSVADLRQPQQ
jgi:hypothetical protein